MNKLSHSEKYFLSQYKNLEKKAGNPLLKPRNLKLLQKQLFGSDDSFEVGKKFFKDTGVLDSIRKDIDTSTPSLKDKIKKTFKKPEMPQDDDLVKDLGQTLLDNSRSMSKRKPEINEQLDTESWINDYVPQFHSVLKKYNVPSMLDETKSVNYSSRKLQRKLELIKDEVSPHFAKYIDNNAREVDNIVKPQYTGHLADHRFENRSIPADIYHPEHLKQYKPKRNILEDINRKTEELSQYTHKELRNMLQNGDINEISYDKAIRLKDYGLSGLLSKFPRINLTPTPGNKLLRWLTGQNRLVNNASASPDSIDFVTHPKATKKDLLNDPGVMAMGRHESAHRKDFHNIFYNEESRNNKLARLLRMLSQHDYAYNSSTRPRSLETNKFLNSSNNIFSRNIFTGDPRVRQAEVMAEWNAGRGTGGNRYIQNRPYMRNLNDSEINNEARDYVNSLPQNLRHIGKQLVQNYNF